MATQNGINMIRGVEVKTPQLAQYQYFPEDYFSGADVAVYFGDVWVDEVTGLQFRLQETVRPIFGYASRTWDAVTRGNRVVQGQIRMGFKEAGYLYTILDHIGQLKEKAKPRLAYLMGDESVPKWIAGVKDNIEDTLTRWNGTLQETKTVESSFVDEYEWDTLKIGDTDATKKNTKQRARGGASGTQYLGAVSQLQDRLKASFPMAPVVFTWKAKGSVPTHPNVLKYHGYPSDYYMIQTWAGATPILKGSDFSGTYKKDDPQIRDLVARLKKFEPVAEVIRKYPIDSLVYGDNLRLAVAKFLEFAGINDGSQGRWVTERCKVALQQGFDVDGVFDAPTRLAVMSYQQKNGLTVDGVVGPVTRKSLSPTGTVKTNKTVTTGPVGNSTGLPEPRFQQYEEEVWGRASSSNVEHSNRTFFYSDRQNGEGGEYLRKKGFDIYINYGAYPENVIRYRGSAAGTISGDAVKFNSTIKAIRNVQLTSVSQVIDASGQPIEEIYEFIAQDID